MRQLSQDFAGVSLESNENSRYYLVSGIPLPGVSFILSSTRSETEEKRLKKWEKTLAAKTGNPDAAKESREKSFARGNKFHSEIYDFIINKKSPDDDSDFFLSVKPFLAGFEARKIIFAEQPMASLELGYGGTPDLVFIFSGELTVLDWTSTDSLYPKRIEFLRHKFLQAAAYSQIINCETDYCVSQLSVVSVNPQNYQIFTRPVSEYLPEWQERMEKFRNSQRV